MQLTLFTLPLLATFTLATPLTRRQFSGNNIAYGNGNTQVNRNSDYYGGGGGYNNNNVAYGNWNTQINNHRGGGWGGPYGSNGNNVAYGYGNYQVNNGYYGW